MANKTFRFYGTGYAESGNAAVAVNFNGNTVYTGTVPTVTESTVDVIVPDVNGQPLMFTFEVDETLYGTFPMSIEVTAGDLVVTAYGESSGAGIPPNPSEYYRLTDEHYGDSRSNVQINGIAQSKGPLGEVFTGPWYWQIPVGATLTADILVLPYGNIGQVGNVTP